MAQPEELVQKRKEGGWDAMDKQFRRCQPFFAFVKLKERAKGTVRTPSIALGH